VSGASVDLVGSFVVRSEEELPSGADGTYAFSTTPGDSVEFSYYGRQVELTVSEGPDRSKWAVLVDGEPVIEDDELLVLDGYSPTERFEVTTVVDAGADGPHVLAVINTNDRNEDATGFTLSIGQFEVLPPPRQSDLGTVLGLLFLVELLGLGFAAVTRGGFNRLAATMTTKRTIMLALSVYAVIAVWGYFLDAVIEFWFLACLVAVVQGGSQALSRSLYAGMSPTSESGEFFGFFSVMSKFSAILGPLLFAGAVALFGSSRPAILSIVVFFIVGIVLLRRVDVDEGRRVAHEADAEAAAANLIDDD